MELKLTDKEKGHIVYLLRIRIGSRYIKDDAAAELNEIYKRLTGYDHMRIAAQK